MISLNDKITLTDGDKGIVKYIGCIQDKNGVFYGIDLLNKNGKNNGTVNNITYFKSEAKKSGKFIKRTKINTKRITKQPNSSSLSFDSDIEINGTKGKVKYIGIPQKQKHAYYGIQFIKASGNSNGKFMKTSISYFKCDKNKGVYVKIRDIDKQMTNKTEPAQKKKRIKNRAKRASTITISKTVRLTEKPADEINKLIASLPEYIMKQWNIYYDHIVHNKYKPIFIDILLHLNMMQFHLNDTLNIDEDETKEGDASQQELFESSLKFMASKMKQLCEDAHDDNNRILHLKDPLVKKYYLNDKLQGMLIMLKYFGWDKMKEMFVFFCDGIDSKINVDSNKKDKHKKDTLFVQNVIGFLNAFMEKKELNVNHVNDTRADIELDAIKEVENEIDAKETAIAEIKEEEKNADEPKTSKMSNYSLFVIEKLFEKKVRKKEEAEAYKIKSFQSQIPMYAKKIVLYDTLNIRVFKYEWESWPEHKYKYMVFRAETNQFVRFVINTTFDNVLQDDIQLASDKDDLIITPLQRRKTSKIKADKGNDGSRVELKIRIKPYQRRDLCLVKLFASQYKWSWKIQQRNTSKKDNNIYLKLAEKLLKSIEREYEDIYTSNNLREISNVNELNSKLFGELQVPFFIDMDFLPFTASIVSTTKDNDDDENKEKDTNNRYRECFETSLFKRVIDMKLSSDYKSYLFLPNKDISYRNIEQGNLPNCGFVASLASFAHKKPQLIKQNIFNVKDDHDTNINEHGLYKLNLYFNGILTQYHVDDFIPSYCFGHKQPSFTKHISNIISAKSNKHNKYNVIWVLLIEKCIAKMYGGYDRLSNMFSLDAFSILTGFPCVDIDYIALNNAAKQDIIWNKLIKFGNHKDILLTTCAHPKRSKRSINDLFGSSWKRKNQYFGMFAEEDGHVWSVVRVEEYKNMKLICLRNPWGETLEDSYAGNGLPGDRWKGKYSRYDTTSWTKELLHEIQPNLKKNDGSFWMSYSDYLLYFYNLNICYCLDNDYDRFYTECCIKYNVEDKNEDILFAKVIIDIQLNEEEEDDDENENKEDSELILEWAGIIQQDINSKNNHIQYTDYMDTCLFVGEIEGNDIKPITLHDVSSTRVNYGEDALNIKLKGNSKYVLVAYTSGHVFYDKKQDLMRNLTITSFISGNKNKKYNITVRNDANGVHLKEMHHLLSRYVMISDDFKKENKKDSDLIFTEKKYGEMIIKAWYHTKNECKLKTEIKFKLDNCLPAVGFDFNRYLIRNRNKFFGTENHVENDKNKKKNGNKPKKTKKGSIIAVNKKHVWKFKLENYASHEICIFIIKKHRKKINRFGYAYSFENAVFESC